ncbi:MAG TPA: glutathione S-transferase family protein [Steroidobacteraceae bacterium]|nr:glutathione S-transferase family protein [Steroidobacteraceae bacterium]
MRLYYSRNLNPRVAVAVARHLEAPVEFVRASPRNPRNTEAFRPINPNTLVPVLVESDRTLWETDAIACRLSMLAKPDFWPAGEQAPELQMWLSWSAHHFTQTAGVFYWEYVVKPMLGLGAPNTDALREATGEFHRFARILEDALSTRTWLVGNRLSYADFRVATPLPFAEAAMLPLQRYGRIREWHDRLCQLPAWKDPFAGLT